MPYMITLNKNTTSEFLLSFWFLYHCYTINKGVGWDVTWSVVEYPNLFLAFFQVTVERDLYICSKLKTLPVIWSLLHCIAAYRPALCYCSVILRAVAAILVGEWSTAAQQRKGIGEDKALVEKTIRLLEIMALGQLLPPPLSSLQEAIPHLPPHQVYIVFNYLYFNFYVFSSLWFILD